MQDIEKMIEENKNLTYFTLNKYFPKYSNDEDMKEIALIGLWKACKEFKEDKKICFSTFAINVIKNKIINAIRYNNRAIFKCEIASLDNTVNGNLSLTHISNLENPHLLNSMLAKEYFVVEAVQKLSEEEKEFFLMVVNGYGERELATVYKVSRQTINNRLNKIRRKLLAEMGVENA